MSLDAIPTTDPFDTFTKTLCVGYDNVTLTRHSLVGRLGIVVAPIINLTGTIAILATRRWNRSTALVQALGKIQLRASEYKNHRIFTLRCIHNDLVPSSIKLKSTIKSTRANQILRKAEKDLLQARVKSINYILDQTSKLLDE